MSQVALCRLDALPDRSARGFDPLGRGADTVFVVRRGGALHAYLDRCPHFGDTPLPWRKDAYLNAARAAIERHPASPDTQHDPTSTAIKGSTEHANPEHEQSPYTENFVDTALHHPQTHALLCTCAVPCAVCGREGKGR